MVRAHHCVCSKWFAYSHLHLCICMRLQSAVLWPHCFACHPAALNDHFISLGNWQITTCPHDIYNYIEECRSHSRPLQGSSHSSPLLPLLLPGFLSCTGPFSHSSTFPGCLFSVQPFGVGFCQKPLKHLERGTASPSSLWPSTPVKGHWWGCRMSGLACPVGSAESRPEHGFMPH